MAIQQVTSANLGKNYNINFNGRNNKQQKQLHNQDNSGITPSKMSIPLATILAAMPLNAETATKLYTKDFDAPEHRIEYVEDAPSTETVSSKSQGVTIETRKFKSKTLGDLTISLKSTDGNKNNFERVEISYLNDNIIFGERVKVNHTAKIKGLYTYDYNVISDDGTKTSRFPVKAVWADDNFTATNDERIMSYIKSLVNDPRNNGALEEKTIKRMIRPATEGAYQNVPNGDILKNATPVTNMGKLVLEQDINDNKIGKFKLRFYSTDDNDNNAERVTFKKENYPEVEIVCCYTPLHTFAKKLENPTEFRSGLISLMDDKYKSYFIESIALTKYLYDMGFDKLFSPDIEYVFVDTGIVAPIVD
ncbi:hypothetical protein DBY21_07435 [Candidatus Gastranaerophilales bacterium]|nr:MAG: hypothetical protein DBY21_07435 [Candidatus Gastranaerophilales bacterium]